MNEINSSPMEVLRFFVNNTAVMKSSPHSWRVRISQSILCSVARKYLWEFPENQMKIPTKFPTQMKFPHYGEKVGFIAFLLTNLLVLAINMSKYIKLDKFWKNQFHTYLNLVFLNSKLTPSFASLNNLMSKTMYLSLEVTLKFAFLRLIYIIY